MKKMFVGLAVCALIFTGCSNNEILENTSPSNAIQFSKLNNSFTKAANDRGSDYRVFAAWSASDRAWYINSLVGGINNSYSPQKYWPKEGQVAFYAYAPYKVDANNFDVADTPATEIKGIYTVATDAQEDFTISTPILAQNSGTASLLFNHMLSKITMTVEFQNSGLFDGYEITEREAKFTLDYNSANFDVMSATPMEIPRGNAGAFEYTLVPGGHKLSNATYLNVLPQPLNNSGELELTVTIKDRATGLDFFKGKLATIPLNNILALNKGQLEGGKWYQFNVTIVGTSTDDKGDSVFNDIRLATDISTWEPGISTPVNQL